MLVWVFVLWSLAPGIGLGIGPGTAVGSAVGPGPGCDIARADEGCRVVGGAGGPAALPGSKAG